MSGRVIRQMSMHLSPLAKFAKFLLVFLQFRIVHVFDIDKLVPRRSRSLYQLVELEVHGVRIPILRILNEEYHEKSEDGRPGVDIELPGIRKAEDEAAHRPCNDEKNSRGKREWRAKHYARSVCTPAKYIMHRLAV